MVMTKNILFIHPSKKIFAEQDNLYANESLTPSLGLAALGAYCRERGIEPQIIDLRLPHRSVEDILQTIREKNPVFIGITAFTNEIIQAAGVARMIKSEFPDQVIVIGGPHSSAIPEETLQEFKEFDVAVIGEGEEIVADLAKSLPLGSRNSLKGIPGIAFRTNNSIELNKLRQDSIDIDKLPIPAWDLFEIEYYYKHFVVSMSRGCPYRCYFCNPGYLGIKTRSKDPVKVADEIEYLVNKFAAQKIQFGDAALSLFREKTIILCDEIIKRGLHNRIEWDCETRADSLNRELLAKMKQAGCRWIALGVETGNEKILKEVINKNETKAQIKQAVRMIRGEGIKIRCFFILGHYTETPQTIKETIDFSLELNPDALSFGLMVPNPGSEIRRIAQDRDSGLRILNNNWDKYNQFDYDCFELTSLPLAELKKWRVNAYFKFYSHHPLKALGLFLDRSGYNYKFSALLKVIPKFIKEKLTVNVNN